MVDNRFVGNKLSTAQIVTSDGIRLDIREVKTPIVCFCSQGDNITPPQQALDWILDNYLSVDEIRRCGQKIFYIVDPKIGHLPIFVGTKVAAKDHAEFINNMELIDAMPPGLYEIQITEKSASLSPSPGEAPGFDLCIEPRSLDDIRALGCNSLEDEREFAAVAQVSELNNALYTTYLQPWIRAMSSPQVARAALKLNPLRLSYSLLSDMSPMRAVAPLAEKARAERTVPAADNPFVAMQQQFSKATIDALNLYRDVRDQLTEQMFHAVYGSPVVQAACGISRNDGPPRPRPGLLPSGRAAVDVEIARLAGRIAEGGHARRCYAGAGVYRQGRASGRRAYLRCPAETVAGASGSLAGRFQDCSARAVGDSDHRRANDAVSFAVGRQSRWRTTMEQSDPDWSVVPTCRTFFVHCGDQAPTYRAALYRIPRAHCEPNLAVSTNWSPVIPGRSDPFDFAEAHD